MKNKQINQTQSNDLKNHEAICALRYEHIEKRLESGDKRFARVEGMIIGLYGLIIASQVYAGMG
tara:strand:+ start:919 stop:1110 length:192 start_codon:yes stop_codon:yes gene_type:complete